MSCGSLLGPACGPDCWQPLLELGGPEYSLPYGWPGTSQRYMALSGFTDRNT